MSNQELIPHLFRTEYSKIVAVLCKTFGLAHIALAEDIASDTFLKATETWGLKGTPEHPKAWLYQVAKNKAKDGFRRELLFREKIRPSLIHSNNTLDEIAIDLSEPNIKDSQLQMLFAVCNPLISVEGQIAMALRILCGFGIEEIAKAFLSNKETINKRLQRAKEKFRTQKITLEIPSEKEMEGRMNNVLSVLYLLYNEGYYATTSEKSLRKELCIEAMRLAYLVLNYPPTNSPQANALMSLFCFHASRFEARTNEQGEQVMYAEQNRAEWNQELVQKGREFLHKSSNGKVITEYHLEAIIAYHHAQIEESENKWEHILQLYNQLLQLKYSPIIALNRTYALSKARGKEKALTEALKINLKDNPLYHLLLAELYTGIDPDLQRTHLEAALQLTTSEHERQTILRKIADLDS